MGTAHPDGIIGAGPWALNLLDFCLGPAHPRPGLLTPFFQAYLQFYEMGTSKSGTWDLGQGLPHSGARFGLIVSHSKARHGRCKAGPGPSHITWPVVEPVAASARTWGGLGGDDGVALSFPAIFVLRMAGKQTVDEHLERSVSGLQEAMSSEDDDTSATQSW